MEVWRIAAASPLTSTAATEPSKGVDAQSQCGLIKEAAPILAALAAALAAAAALATATAAAAVPALAALAAPGGVELA